MVSGRNSIVALSLNIASSHDESLEVDRSLESGLPVLLNVHYTHFNITSSVGMARSGPHGRRPGIHTFVCGRYVTAILFITNETPFEIVTHCVVLYRHFP